MREDTLAMSRILGIVRYDLSVKKRRSRLHTHTRQPLEHPPLQDQARQMDFDAVSTIRDRLSSPKNAIHFRAIIHSMES